MALGAILSFYLLGGDEYLTLDWVQKNLGSLRESYENNPVTVTSVFLGIYLFLTSLSIPGSIILTLISGSLFGLGLGTFWVISGTTLGATLAFLLSRYLFRDFFERKFRAQFERMNRRVKDEGVPYLFTLRMIPVSPYVVINIVMGLTDMRLWSFMWVTALGMLPGTFLYVLAGRKISEIESVSEILSWEILLALTFLGILPLIVRWYVRTHPRSGRWAHE